MGTTMSYYFIANTGEPPDALREKLAAVSRKSEQKNEMLDSMIERLFLLDNTAPEKQEEVKEFIKNMRQGKIPGLYQPQRATATAIAYCKEAKWLPLFDATLCEGYTASSRDALKLSKNFGAPVLAFAIYDSDALFCSYGDAKTGQKHDFAKPNFDEFDEYDDELYTNGFPDFLLWLCEPGERDKLKEAWNVTDEGMVFADERLENVCEILGIEPIFDSEHAPGGYDFIFV